MMKNAIILGCSSGFGRATSLKLADEGYNIFGVHLDFGKNKEKAEEISDEIKSKGVFVKFYNSNAADEINRIEIINDIQNELEELDNKKISVLIHSLAFGALGPLIHEDPAKQLTRKKMDMTLNVMANSLLYWSQDLFHSNLFAENARVFALTSAGSGGVMKNYGGISVAKCALEAYVRQLAVELAPYKITVNALMPGTTDTPAGNVIPGFREMLHFAKQINPYKRNTQPTDIANVIALLSDEKSYWITGQIIGVDGGEDIVHFVPEEEGE
ncbi:MAG: SDR family oxidoreductase [bacterium]